MIESNLIENDFVLYHRDYNEILEQFDSEKFHLIFADLPYFLSNDGKISSSLYIKYRKHKIKIKLQNRS